MKKNPWLPFLFVSLLILILTSIPKIPQPQTKIHFLDKVAHFFIYLLWGYTITILWRSKTKRSRFYVISIVTLLLFFPAFDELHQYLIPARTPSFLDWLSDIIGAITGFSIFVKSVKGS